MPAWLVTDQNWHNMEIERSHLDRTEPVRETILYPPSVASRGVPNRPSVLAVKVLSQLVGQIEGTDFHGLLCSRTYKILYFQLDVRETHRNSDTAT
jgi:hypothetical protein